MRHNTAERLPEQGGSALFAASDLAFYEPKDRRTAGLNLRVPERLKESLADLQRLWTHLERERTGNKDAEVSLTDVAVRLLQVASEGAWAEVGGRPLDETAWKQLLKTAGEKIAVASKQR